MRSAQRRFIGHTVMSQNAPASSYVLELRACHRSHVTISWQFTPRQMIDIKYKSSDECAGRQAHSSDDMCSFSGRCYVAVITFMQFCP